MDQPASTIPAFEEKEKEDIHNTVSTENKNNIENTENTKDTESKENIENTKDTESKEEVNTESKDNIENTENKDNIENTNLPIQEELPQIRTTISITEPPESINTNNTSEPFPKPQANTTQDVKEKTGMATMAGRRHKVVLAPGHSHMDWMRKTNTEPNLSGVQLSSIH